MNSSFARKPLRFTCVAVTAIFALASICQAQMNGQSAGPNMMQATNSMEDRLYVGTTDIQADREQGAAYQAFFKERDPAKKIQLGSRFLQTYPKSPLAERVDFGLMNVYRAQQDWKNAYRFADYALALQPDDVDVLTTVGWTIPHVYSPNDPDADEELNRAETYARHAIEVLAKMPKPPDLNGAQFAAAKAKRTFQAHSALGLVYFRREDYDNSAKELEQATKGNPTPDQTDLYVLGTDLQNLNRYREAADAFRGCSQIAGVLQDPCKQNADLARRQADVTKTK